MTTDPADVLIVFGQGTYRDGEYHAELPDRDVFIGHAASVREIVARFNYSHVVCSGARTQPAMRDRSEAESFLDLWRDLKVLPDVAHGIALDELALDSAESVYLGLIAARIALGTRPIRRVGVSLAWRFKKARVIHVASDLGITSRFYFHGFASASRSLIGDELLAREREFLDRIERSGDCLLLSSEYDETRRRRFCGDADEPGYDERVRAFPRGLDLLRERFADVFAALDAVRNDRTPATLADLHRTLGAHIIRGEP